MIDFGSGTRIHSAAQRKNCLPLLSVLEHSLSLVFAEIENSLFLMQTALKRHVEKEITYLLKPHFMSLCFGVELSGTLRGAEHDRQRGHRFFAVLR